MTDTLNHSHLNIEHYIKDFGPVYFETTPEHFQNIVVEPWNAFSSLALIIPAIIGYILLKGKYKSHFFITYIGMPLSALGGIGSTLFHAFRNSDFFLLLDFVPVAILSLAIAIYFLNILLRRWWLSVLIIIGFLILRSLSFQIWEGNRQTAISISYLLTGIMVSTPILLFLIKSKFKFAKYILLSILFFGTSLVFRAIDNIDGQVLPMGTHFLWHIFSALGAFLLGVYIYFVDILRFQIFKKEIY